MRAVVQRVLRCRVESGGIVSGEIARGLLVYLGVAADDSTRDAEFLADKVAHLRVFDDPSGRMNLDVQQAGGGVIVVSQFTLYGDTRKGRRPSYNRAAEPNLAERLYRDFIADIAARGIEVGTGAFQQHMDVVSVNDGPVTILIDSRKEF